MTGVRLKILLVEDEDLNRTLVKAVLARAQIDAVRRAEVIDAGTLATAREQLGQQDVDLVLLDMNLPDGNGLTLARELAATARHTSPTTTAPSSATTMAPGSATTVAPSSATTIPPGSATTIPPGSATTITPGSATTVGSGSGSAVAPGRRRPVVIAVTASVLPQDRAAAIDAGCDGFLDKPYAAADLVAIVAKHLPHPLER